LVSEHEAALKSSYPPFSDFSDPMLKKAYFCQSGEAEEVVFQSSFVGLVLSTFIDFAWWMIEAHLIISFDSLRCSLSKSLPVDVLRFYA
jgi:hypothetical protein